MSLAVSRQALVLMVGILFLLTWFWSWWCCRWWCCRRFAPPSYDSGWQQIAQSGTLQLNHNLGVDPDRMMVDLEFKASAVLGLAGLNNAFYGTSMTGAGSTGAYWTALTNTTINVFREANDNSAENVRIRIWVY